MVIKYITLSALLLAFLSTSVHSADIAKPEVRSATFEEVTSGLIKSGSGKVLVVNFWATWCIPCVQELPEFVKLHEKYKDRGLVIVAVSEDNASVKDITRTEKLIKRFLKKKITLPFTVLIDNSGKETEVKKFYDKKWKGALPGTFIYDPKGKQVLSHTTGALKYEDLVKVIEPILPKKKPSTAGTKK
jgi:thiol-disulfide isomerase/thioredoxin